MAISKYLKEAMQRWGIVYGSEMARWLNIRPQTFRKYLRGERGTPESLINSINKIDDKMISRRILLESLKQIAKQYDNVKNSKYQISKKTLNLVRKEIKHNTHIVIKEIESIAKLI